MKEKRTGGFTLLEIILVVVLVGIVATMASTFVNKGLVRNDIPLTALQTEAELQGVMENMIQDFYANAIYYNDLKTFQSHIRAENLYATAGMTYYLAENQCKQLTGTTFQNDTTNCAYLYVTIKPSAASGVTLSYLFTQKSS